MAEIINEDIKPDHQNIPAVLAVIQNELKHINEHLTKIDETTTKISETATVVADHEHRLTEIEKTLEEAKEDRKWFSRAIWGSLIAGIGGIIFGLINFLKH